MEPGPLGLDHPADAKDAAGDSSGLPTAMGAAAPRIGIVRNPRSHRNRDTAAPDPGDPDLLGPNLLVTAPASRPELTETLARFAALDIELLVIDGGDGTMREVMCAGAPIFGDRWPKLLLLPKGKTNALAIDLGMPGKYSLAEALGAIPQADVVTRRPILLERQDAECRQVLGFIMGTGVFNAAIAAGQVAHRFGAFQGLAVAAATLFGVIQALFGIGRSPWRALSGMRLHTADGRARPHSRHGVPDRHFAAGFSTLGKFPLGMQPFGHVPGRTGEIIRYVLVDAPLRRVVALVPAILMGFDRPFLRRLGLHRGASEAMTLELEGSFILDGEAFPPGRYGLRLGPELRFLVP